MNRTVHFYVLNKLSKFQEDHIHKHIIGINMQITKLKLTIDYVHTYINVEGSILILRDSTAGLVDVVDKLKKF